MRGEPSGGVCQSKPEETRPWTATATPAPGLHLVATPIGNLTDISLRALAVLQGADRVYCEDTRVTARLFTRYGITTPLASYHDHNAEAVRPAILAALRRGERVALVSDAGTPLVSDPGYKLVRAAIAENLPVTAVPGASAVLTALVLSGLPPDRFLFVGFLPRQRTARRRDLAQLAKLSATLIVYEAAPRLAAALAAALVFTGFGYSTAAVAAVVIGAVAAGAAISSSGSAGRSTSIRGMWAAAGVIYAGAAFFGPALLRRDAELGFAAFLFVALTVWGTDICAFAIGRAIGGPLLWPRVSPNKTWSGAIGGLAGGVAGGTLVAYAGRLDRLAVVGVIALLLSALAQAGDLLESAIKRHFGAKDTSQLIPGHGGLMDRLDGFLVAAAAALLIGILRQGTAAAAHGLLIW